MTERLLQELNDLATRHGSTLVVVPLVPNSRYVSYMTSHGIRQIDCGRELTPALKVAAPGSVQRASTSPRMRAG